MRTFVAVRPPAVAVGHLRAVLPSWPSAPERWHLTLAFLGEVEDPSALVPGLAGVCARRAPLELRLAGSGAFGRGGPVWVGVEGDRAGLTALAGAVASACRDVGVDVERRPYRPHLTVGRRGRPDPARLAAYAGPVWTASEVELVASRLGPPVEHRVLERLPLTG
ncbi:MAG: RNA 2',3'-cyclic phosphodiesterase [Actinomycetota bacterium]|nr:RNA 2',3'-cyclic phosphodiesterase [Actinomycetota bacterium]